MGEQAIILLSIHKRFVLGLGIGHYNHYESWVSFGFITLNIEFKKKTKDNAYFKFDKD